MQEYQEGTLDISVDSDNSDNDFWYTLSIPLLFLNHHFAFNTIYYLGSPAG